MPRRIVYGEKRLILAWLWRFPSVLGRSALKVPLRAQDITAEMSEGQNCSRRPKARRGWGPTVLWVHIYKDIKTSSDLDLLKW